jgi:HEAT repeat protein
MADRIAELIFSFAHADATGRERAAAELVRAGAEAVPRLIAALDHPDDAVRGHAALTLGYTKAEEAGPALAKLVDDAATSDRLRGLAMRALAEVANPEAAPVLFPVAAKRRTDRDLFVRALACTVLGKLADARGKPLLEASLRDGESWVREAAHRALSELRAAVPAQPTPAQPTVPAAAVPGSQVVRVEAPAPRLDPVQQAISALRGPDQAGRDQAMHDLCQLGARAVPALLRVMYDPHVILAASAVQALGRIGDRRALPNLVDLLRGPSTGDTLRAVVLHAIAALLDGGGGTPELGEIPIELGPVVLEQTRHLDRFVRAAALHALARVAAEGMPHRAQLGTQVRQVIAASLDDPDGWVREAAAGSAARYLSSDDTTILPRLIDALSTTLEPRIQARLLRAISRVATRGGPAERTAIGPALHFLSSGDSTVRVEALEVLGRFLGPQADPRLCDDITRCLSDPDPATRRLALSLCAERLPIGYSAALGPIVAQVDRMAPEATRLVALALGRIGDEAAVDALLELAVDADHFTAQSARQALSRLPREAPVQVTQDDNGEYHKVLAYRCRCGGLLEFATADGREELRCPSCGTAHLISPAGQAMPVSEAPLGVCLCQSCRRPQLLIQGAGDAAGFLVCSRTAIRHVRPYDRPQEIRRLDQLPLGACRCCQEVQPLEREASADASGAAERVVCHRTRRLHLLVDGAWLPAGSAATTDVAAINRALIGGSMAVATSGLPVDDETAPPAGGAPGAGVAAPGDASGASPAGPGLPPGRGFGPRQDPHR